MTDSNTASPGGAMGHYLRIHDDWDEIRLALVCTAAPGSPCRLRPADGRGEWTYADADLIDSGVCWAVEWADDGGWEAVVAAEGVTWPMIPVTVEYEYEMGPVVAPVIPQPDLPDVLGLLDEADALRAELAHMREARDNARAEVERLTAKVERLRGLYYAARRDVTRTPACEACHGKAGVHES